MTTPRTMTHAMQRLVTSALSDVRISVPARVERYDASLQQIDAQPLIKEAYEDEEGERVAAQLPVICNVPVIFPGAGSFRLTFPIEVGDIVHILFSHSSLDVWLSEGGLVDPNDDRRLNISDAVAIPGIRSFKEPLSSAPTDRMTLGHDTGSVINIDENTVRLNTTTGQLVALANKVLTELQAIRTQHNAHVHATAVGPTAVPTVPMTAPNSVASDGVYAKE